MTRVYYITGVPIACITIIKIFDNNYISGDLRSLKYYKKLRLRLLNIQTAICARNNNIGISTFPR